MTLEQQTFLGQISEIVRLAVQSGVESGNERAEVALESLNEARNEVERLREKNHRLYEALEHMETTLEKSQDWATDCAERRVKAEAKWAEVAMENAVLRDRLNQQQRDGK